MSINSYVTEAPAETIASVCRELITKGTSDENLLTALVGRFSDLKGTIDIKQYIGDANV